jgi:HTH-type transcriptional regulator/antitoxin MqsA
MSETRIHPETGQELRRDTRPQTVCVGSLSRVVDVPGWYPDGDGDAIHSGEDLRAFDEAFKELREAYAARIKTVRKKLGLTQEEAGVIIGGGKRAFQKYESGRTPPSDGSGPHRNPGPSSRGGRNSAIVPHGAPKAMTPDPRSSGAPSPIGKRIKRGVRNAAA